VASHVRHVRHHRRHPGVCRRRRVAEAAPNAEEPCDGSTFPRVGSRVDGQFLNAIIDEVAVWNRALTVDEVIQNMATALSTPVEPQGKLATSWGMTKRAY